MVSHNGSVEVEPAQEETALTPVLARVLTPTPSLVLALQAVRGYPCVSLLLSTTRGDRMTAHDLHRLRALADRALDRLDRSGHRGRGSPLADTLTELVEAAAAERTGTAVAVLAARAVGRVVRLSIPVVERVVVDHTFATRDLVRTLHRTPRHLVLVLEPHRARLLDGAGGDLRPAATAGFPLHSGTDLTDQRREEDRRAFLDTVDRRLGVFRELHPCPLVVAGHPRVVEAHLRTTRHGHRLAGVLKSADVPTSVEELRSRTAWVLAAYLASREREAMELLARRTRAGRTVSGIHAVWAAARRGAPEMLAVEPGLLLPARLHPGGDALTLVDSVGDPDVVDDVVDELIELVLARGGWVAFVEDGRLDEHGGVALTLR